MNDLQIFNKEEFGTIRTIEIGGEPWIAGRDVAISLGYVKPQNAIEAITKDGKALLTEEDGTTTSLRDVVGVMAISLYRDYTEYRQSTDETEKQGMRKELSVSSKLLDSMSGALSAVQNRHSLSPSEQSESISGGVARAVEKAIRGTNEAAQ